MFSPSFHNLKEIIQANFKEEYHERICVIIVNWLREKWRGFEGISIFVIIENWLREKWRG